MAKIPVGATIAQTYNFVFGRFFTLLGIVWLSWAVLAGAGLVFLNQSMAVSTAMATRNFSGIGPALLVLIPLYFVGLLMLLMQYMGFTEQALGLRKGSPYFYFKLGQPLWRLALSILLVILIFAAVIVGMILVVAALSGTGGLVVGLLSLIFYCAFIYLWVRLTFLLTPVVVAENHLGLARAWALGKGNFWRIFVIILAVIVPVFIVMGILMAIFMFRGMPLPPPGADPAQLAQYRAAVAAWQVGMTARMMGTWYITFPVYLVFTVVFYGLSAAAQAFAYRALTPEDPAAEFS